VPSGEHILVVESEAAASAGLLELLHRAGYRATPAASLPEIHSLVHTNHIDVLLLNENTAGLDAAALLAELKGASATETIRIILLAAADAAGRARWLDLGADDALAWPGDARELLARVRAQLRAGRSLRHWWDKARLAEEGQRIAHTAFEALAVTEKMTRDAFRLDRRLNRGIAMFIVVAMVMAGIFFLFSRIARQETQRAYAAITKLERGIASGEDLVARAGKMRDEMEKSAATTLEQHRERLEQQSEQLRTRMAEAGSAEVSALRKQLDETSGQIRRLESASKVAQNIIRTYSSSVCLLHVTIAFRHRESGMRLRYGGITPQGQPLADSEGNPVVGIDGTGPEVRADFFGTGFLAARDGRILTNRHVIEPWWKDTELAAVTREGVDPMIAEINAYFPGEPRAVRVSTRKVSPTVDLAIVQGDLSALKRAVLQLDSRKEAAVSGQAVMLMGYATGLDAILARAGEDTVRSIVQAAGGNPREIMAQLAQRNLIRPLTTQGHVGDVLADKIVYDAQTTHGGSGGPLFNAQGKVIGVNFAVVRGFGGSNFGIPIRYAEQLLK
jgi:DNA-binding response OmpR family regulator/S1-C subfamily serine protease